MNFVSCKFCFICWLPQGSTVLKRPVRTVVKHRDDGTPVERDRVQEVVLHCDIIGDAFWQEHQQLLGLTE